ncbi:MAG: hypothetical protein AAGC88_11345, partial [Bacteroidota bacterium]
MKRLLFIVMFALLNGLRYSLLAQLTDDFSDGDFTNNPTWSGETTDFSVTSGRLQLTSSGENESHLTVANALFGSVVWEFSVELDFNPSSGNRAFVYLASDQSDLESDLNGYYVLLGNSSDEIALYRQTAGSVSKLISTDDEVDKILDNSSNVVSVRVTRSTS